MLEPAEPVPTPEGDSEPDFAQDLHEDFARCWDGDDDPTDGTWREIQADRAMAVVGPELARLRDENERLHLELQGYQVGDPYERGHEHGHEHGVQATLARLSGGNTPAPSETKYPDLRDHIAEAVDRALPGHPNAAHDLYFELAKVVEDEVARTTPQSPADVVAQVRAAINDPGQYVQRGKDSSNPEYYESVGNWGARAVHALISSPGWGSAVATPDDTPVGGLQVGDPVEISTLKVEWSPGVVVATAPLRVQSDDTGNVTTGPTGIRPASPAGDAALLAEVERREDAEDRTHHDTFNPVMSIERQISEDLRYGALLAAATTAPEGHRFAGEDRCQCGEVVKTAFAYRLHTDAVREQLAAPTAQPEETRTDG